MSILYRSSVCPHIHTNLTPCRLSEVQARHHPPLVVRRTNLKESAHFGPRIRGPKHSSLDQRDQIRQISSGIPSVAAEISAVVMGDGLARREGYISSHSCKRAQEARRDAVRRVNQWSQWTSISRVWDSRPVGRHQHSKAGRTSEGGVVVDLSFPIQDCRGSCRVVVVALARFFCSRAICSCGLVVHRHSRTTVFH